MRSVLRDRADQILSGWAASVAPLVEVTDLRYASDQWVRVTTTRPVNELWVSATILSPEAWCFGCRVTPTYLK